MLRCTVLAQVVGVFPDFLADRRGLEKNKQIRLSNVVENGLDRIERFYRFERFVNRSPE